MLSMNHLARLILAATLAFAALFALLKTTYSGDTTGVPPSPPEDVFIFLPIIYAPITPAGTYTCYEYEFGLIWKVEVVTLNADGSSIYDYNPSYTAVVTGTWLYTPAIQEVGFTNFRWPTATFQAPDRLWASRYLTYAGFEIALSCNRHP
jgi:hypothetical protein